MKKITRLLILGIMLILAACQANTNGHPVPQTGGQAPTATASQPLAQPSSPSTNSQATLPAVTQPPAASPALQTMPAGTASSVATPSATSGTGPIGDVVQLPPNPQQHIPEGTVPGPYSNPPAGGPHYPVTLKPGFYNESDLATLPKYPEGYLDHNLEHGYIIFWYNCANLSQAACDTLKSQIKGVMDQFPGGKLIAFPWKILPEPVAMTSWGRMLRFTSFDPALAAEFVRRNMNQAPEPTAP